MPPKAMPKKATPKQAATKQYMVLFSKCGEPKQMGEDDGAYGPYENIATAKRAAVEYMPTDEDDCAAYVIEIVAVGRRGDLNWE